MSETQGSEQGAGAADAAEKAASTRSVTLKAVLTGLVLVVVLALAIPWNDWSLRNTQLYNNYLPPIVTVAIMGLVLLVNPWLGRFRYRRGELVVIVVMLLGLGGVVSGGLVRVLPMAMAGPARHLATRANYEPMQEALTAAEQAAIQRERLVVMEAWLASYDSDGDGTVQVAELPGERAAVIDGDHDGVVSAAELLAERGRMGKEASAEYRWPVPRDVVIGVPESGPIRRDDPEYRYVVDGYLDSLPTLAEGETPRVEHRSTVTWRDRDGTVREQVALAGEARETALLAGDDFLDLDDPRSGQLLRGEQAGAEIAVPGGSLAVVAVEQPGVPWYAWWRPLITWLPLLLGAFIAMIATAGVVRRQWIHHERLPYPIAQVTLELMDDPALGRKYPPVFYQRGFWIAFVVVSAIIIWRGLFVLNIVPINIVLDLDFWSVLRGEPFSRMPEGYWLAKPRIWFSIVAMAFFMSLQVSFSLWFTFLLANFLFAYLAMAGVPVGRREFQESTTGGFMGMAMVIVWLGRHYYWSVCKAAIGLDRSDEAREAAPYLWALLLGCGTMVAFLLWHGAPFSGSVLLVLLFLVLLLVLARIVAEAGVPFVQTGGSTRINIIMFTIFGTGLPVGVLLPLGIIGAALGADNREALLPYAVNASAIGEGAKVRPRRLSVVMLGAAAVGTVVAFVSMVAAGYHGEGGTVDSWSLGVIGRHALEPINSLAVAAEGKEQMLRLNEERVDSYINFASGGAVVALLGWGRMMFSWWPLHPVGFLLMSSWCTLITWASFMVGWLWKAMVMRYGGTGLYQKLKPVAIGMIAGEAVTAFLFMLVRLVALYFDYDMPEFKTLPR
ncbi:MAG: hypothetical protein PF961_10760 [Planctomycetota bacterium]|jgi:hypothetical protein|nr:hypothetical protein [Planctomycetota bacterium]